MRTQQIIRLACDIKSVWKTNNPFEIAEKYGIKVLIRNVNIGDNKFTKKFVIMFPPFC